MGLALAFGPRCANGHAGRVRNCNAMGLALAFGPRCANGHAGRVRKSYTGGRYCL
ncbi:MAG: hypothetical protein F6J94_08700 [Moorea sp. SIO1F2]|uniref:hypothetical protein n=1 Tax=unclassified Moorena TaxID=2683338 RepID=UPI0013B743DB|nr:MULTISPECIES: hypothetical protein [unclassified Moorena]NEO01143.1 hypothetical protein [Moorena sp. SIO3I7]NEO66957.1 hypothetical protein [Moorena sp. SIO4G2]NEO04062.1 hypothetical protein [Moorena sp. SIO3I8]NEO19688.1 hypothetical protein [Moorena sp. SIO4A5]NEP26947.1 hypothetical protein [Moorena sp. SIO3I6]